MTEETSSDSATAFYEALCGWIVGTYIESIAGVLRRGEATLSRYEEEFAACCNKAFERFELADCGYKDVDDLIDEFGPAFTHFIEQYRVKQRGVDVAPSLWWEEQIMYAQHTSPEEKQELWDAAAMP